MITLYLIRELKKNHLNAIAMAVAKEAELKSIGFKTGSNYERKEHIEKSFPSKDNQSNGPCFHSGKKGYYKRDCLSLHGTKGNR